MVSSGTNIQLKTFNQEQDWQLFCLSFIKDIATRCIGRDKVFRLALSGGSTPKPIYARFQETQLDYSQIEIFQVDERYVPQNSTDLNANMLRATILSANQTFRALHLFDTELLWQQAAAAYNNLLQSITKPLFHLTILGIGPDGHTASLFPHSAALYSSDLVTTSTTDAFAGHQRLTLTAKALLASEHILILVAGKEKAEVVQRFMVGEDSLDNFPIMCVRQHPQVTVVYRDS